MSEHPGKICDQVSHADLTTNFTSGSMTMVTGEITVTGNIDHETVVRRVVKDICFDSLVDDLNSVDSKGLNYRGCEVLIRINKKLCMALCVLAVAAAAVQVHPEFNAQIHVLACNTKEFLTYKLRCTIIDTPGHKDFIKDTPQTDVALITR